MMDVNCRRLRSLVHNCLSSGLLPSACFFGDKLVSLSGGTNADTYLLAQVSDGFTRVHPPAETNLADLKCYSQCYFASKQYRRALSLLSNSSSGGGGRGGECRPDSPPLFKCLMAKCMAECGEWEECLALLGDEEGHDNDDDDGLRRPGMQSQRQGDDLCHVRPSQNNPISFHRRR